jgi:hypothetical protein
MDVKFEEHRALRKSHDTVPEVADDREQEALNIEEKTTSPTISTQSLGQEEEQEAPSTSAKRRPRWIEKTLRYAQEHVEAPRSTFREVRPLRQFPRYMLLMSDIIDSRPSSYEEAACQQVWRDAMVEEYASIMKNDVWILCRGHKGNQWSVLSGSTR